jgi:hypothetical protein
LSLGAAKRQGHDPGRTERSKQREIGEGVNHYYCDIGFWRASDHEAVARHLTDRTRMSGEPDPPRRVGLVRSASLRMLRMVGLAEQPVEAKPLEREETLARESCDCGGEDEFEYREEVIDDGEWVLRCPECGHLDRLRWLSDEARPLVLAVARRRRLLRLRREVG